MPGPRNPGFTPYIIDIERAVVSGQWRRIVAVMASQMGKTEMMLDLAGQRLDQRPAPILYVGPNKQFLTEQFEPRVMALLDEAPSLMAKVARGKRMTKTRKVVAGVPLRLAHAGSSAALKSDPAALALVDEYDEMLANVRQQGDPLGLVERRGDTFADFCCVVTSTPRIGLVVPEGVPDERSGLIFWAMVPAEEMDTLQSPVWRLWQQGTRHHCCWPCPHCGDYFVPRFDRVRWPDDASPVQAAAQAFVECPRCGGVITERAKADMNARRRYVAPGQAIDRHGRVTGEPASVTTLSYWVSGLMSPFVSIGDRVRSYLEAQALADPAMLQTAVNAGFGEVYSPGGASLREWQEVAKRRGLHHFGEVPAEVQRLTCAIDVGKRGVIYSIRGWGGRASSWQIESGEIAGYTDSPEVWADVATLITSTFANLPISIVLIDSGFRPNKEGEASANAVYQFCRRFSRIARPTKGYLTLTAPIIRTRTKVAIPGRSLTTTIELVRLDTDFWKSRVHDRFAWPEDQPGGITLSVDATDDYCRQIVSEVRRVDAAGKPIWITLNRRNHFLDCEAMNEAAGHMLGVARIPVGTLRDMPEDEVEGEGDDAGAEPRERDAPMSIADVARRLNNPRGTHL